MNVRVFAIWCALCGLQVVLAQKIEKNADYEDVYGELENPDVQKDGTDYYGEVGPDSPPDENIPETELNVKLISKSATYALSLGDKVVLPCDVAAPADHFPVRLWRKDRVMIFQDEVKTLENANMKVKNGTLEFTLLTESDFGNYSCELLLSDTVRPSVDYKVISREPKITQLYIENNQTVFSPGDRLTINCIATGEPNPRITWHRGSERLVPEGTTLIIPNLKETDGGIYRCLADNPGKKVDHRHIEIYVKHAPIVSLQEYLVNSDHKKEAEFVCLVDAYPGPVAEWRKDGQVLIDNDKYRIAHQNGFSRNTLTVKDLNENDFGIYSCIVRNAHGTVIENATLVKTPVVKKLEKDAVEATNEVILQWKVESKQPILNHELQYRKKGESQWKNISPTINPGNNDVYLIKQTLNNLEPGIYETRARSKNQHGWSHYSDIMPFDAAKHVNHHHKSKHNKKEPKLKAQDGVNTPAQHRSEGQLGESISSSMNIQPSTHMVLFAITSLICFHIRQQILS